MASMQAMEYMVNCKYVEAAEQSGHPVDCHCVILVSLHLVTHASLFMCLAVPANPSRVKLQLLHSFLTEY